MSKMIASGDDGKGGMDLVVVVGGVIIVIVVVVVLDEEWWGRDVFLVANEKSVEVEVKEVLLLAIEDGQVDVAEELDRVHDGHFNDLLTKILDEQSQ